MKIAPSLKILRVLKLLEINRFWSKILIVDNAACWIWQAGKPAHLFWGSDHDNKQDAGNKGRLPHQLRPLFRGEKNQQAKLKESQVLAIRMDTDTHDKIAAKYGISRQTIGCIKSRRLWGYL